MKKNRWNTTKLVAIGSIAVIMTLFQLLGAGIQTVTGFIGIGGIINSLVTPTFIVICILLIDKFGSGTLMLFVQSILILALPLTGTPGFIPKILILSISGLISDIVYLLLKQNRLAFSLTTGGLVTLFIGFSLAEIGRFMQLPGIEKVINAFYSPVVFVGITIGCIGGLIGYRIFLRIKKTSIAKRIQR